MFKNELNGKVFTTREDAENDFMNCAEVDNCLYDTFTQSYEFYDSDMFDLIFASPFEAERRLDTMREEITGKTLKKYIQEINISKDIIIEKLFLLLDKKAVANAMTPGELDEVAELSEMYNTIIEVDK